MSTLLPLYDRVLIKRGKKDDTTASGIFIYNRREDTMDSGTVVAVGPGKKLPRDGAILYPSVAPGDKVIFDQHRAKPLTFEGEDLVQLEDADILAVVTP